MSKLLISSASRHISQTLQYGNEKIFYRVFFVPNQKTKIIIDVLPDGKVYVKSPEGVELKDVKRALQKRARWVSQHIRKTHQQFMHVLPRQYVSGESHYYLGRRYVLKIIKVKKAQPHVKLLRGRLQIRTHSRNPETIKKLLYNWYREHAEDIFERRLELLAHNLLWLKRIPPWKLLLMKKQWGSCSPKGTLSLNPLLVKAPVVCVDYVILHELCHLKEHNHSKRFYKLLHKHMPDWEAVKGKLDGMSELLLAE